MNPLWHALHVDAPEPEYEPAAQLLHDVELPPALKVPALQLKQDEPYRYEPGEQVRA